ncbi:endonuclease III [Planctomycetota bacterium]
MAKKKISKQTLKANRKTQASKAGRFDKAAVAERLKKIYPIFKRTYPNAKTALNFKNPLELLIATILSAQCTDKQVNLVTARVFTKYKSIADWARADIKEIESDIKSTGFYRNKAANIQNACSMIESQFAGKLPDTMTELVKLPGVGRKTANVVLGNAFGKPAIACDTHVIRLSRRLRLSSNSDPVKLEFDLAEIIPKKNWTLFSHLLIFHGRNVCKARRPDCESCSILKYCPAANKPGLW